MSKLSKLSKKRVMLVFGTRPEAIKMAPLVKELEKEDAFEVAVAVTAQHREMLDRVLELFDIKPLYDLNIMKHGQDLFDITCSVLQGLKDVLKEWKPDILLVHGDTTTTMAASLAGFYCGVPVGHVEAGLRTDNKLSPWPEEVNRRITDVITDYYFAPTETNLNNLLRENVPREKIFITGNTVIDALHMAVARECDLKACGVPEIKAGHRLVTLTCHRRENWGEPMENIFAAVAELVEEFDDIEVVYPMHKNPLVREIAGRHLKDNPRIHLIEPLDYHPFSALMNISYLILTDSGGIQEEAPSLGKPVLVLRDTTERPEAVAAGTVKLAGTSKQDIIREAKLLLKDDKAYAEMAALANPYGDGSASKQICRILADNV